ncbi:MAG: hypothetical protein MUE50_03945 [Pirellulaceae bacterium]|nr:hypothetical protein [Pirellulaceae bacterium]
MVERGWRAWKFGVRDEGWILRKRWYWITFRRRVSPPCPGPVTIRVAVEDSEMLTFFVDLQLKTEAEFDVVKRIVRVSVAGVPVDAVEVPVEMLEVGPFNGQQGDAVSVECFNVDDAGNVSETGSTLEAVLQDTFAPPAPGQIGLRVVGENADAPPPASPTD